jgi:hypothetical protein
MTNMSAGAVRLGHALAPGGDETAALREAIEVASGHRTLTARPPRAGAVVLRAEAWLGADPRPVYAYVGDLHPALGQVGLVIERQWADRAIQGASRCDSGGLAGGVGGFGGIAGPARKEALDAVSFPQCGQPVSDWAAAFDAEVGASYAGGAAGYVQGEEPDVSGWSDARKTCVQTAASAPDRRLWTWELRMSGGPQSTEVVAIAASVGAARLVEAMRQEDPSFDIPPHVTFCPATANREGVGPFATEAVRAKLMGR